MKCNYSCKNLCVYGSIYNMDISVHINTEEVFLKI